MKFSLVFQETLNSIYGKKNLVAYNSRGDGSMYRCQFVFTENDQSKLLEAEGTYIDSTEQHKMILPFCSNRLS